MNVTIVGTGNMARALATRALAAGHHVTFVGTYIAKAQDIADEFSAQGETRASERADGDLVILAVPYHDAPHVVRQHAEELAERPSVVVDITNPVSRDFEPIPVELGSAAEAIAAAAPAAVPIVKAFNTTFAGTLISGQVAGQPLDVFVAADDDRAKGTVRGFVHDGGMRSIDAGPLRRARELEALGYLHMAIQHDLSRPFASALKVLTP